MKKRNKSIYNFLILGLIVLNYIAWSDYSTLVKYNDQSLIYFANVGQADSILIKTKGNQFGLIDTGKNEKILDELARFVPKTKTQIDFIIITHNDLDHIGGLPYILENYEVANLFINKSLKGSPEYLEILKDVEQNTITQFDLYSQHDFVFEEFKFDVVWPVNSDEYFSLETNDSSIAIKVDVYKNTIFLGGDLSSEIEDSIANQINDIDILKAGHHGSKFSSSNIFLDKLDPELVVLSYGEANPYGHPSTELLERLNTKQIDFLSTAKNNGVLVKFENDSYKVLN